jgi:ornithine cyclodeaminase/alanine dehydrogenase-like protein (mu-crystallin family)
MAELRTPSGSTLILTRTDVRESLDMAECIEAVERAFRLHGTGEAPAPAVASVHVPEGAFHVKAGVLPVGNRSYFVAKTNANFPRNPSRYGLPTIQGTLVVCDTDRGTPLVLMDSSEITALRTAAATAVAAKHLSRNDATRLAIIGCGLQGESHVRALSLVRQVASVALYDLNPDAARSLAGQVERDFSWKATVAASPAEAAARADIVVTCTTSTEFLLGADDVAAGAFVAGVGVDSERKRELHPELLRRSKVVVDVLAQCAAFGDLHHAIEASVMQPDAVYAELGAIVARRLPGRESETEVIVFDSTGMALQDVAAASLIYGRALTLGRGTIVNFAQ